MIPLETIGVALIGYLLGSIPFGVLVAKRFGVDIYSVGSGNPGATNVLREIGKPAGYTVFVFDFLKGFLATYWFMIPVFPSRQILSFGVMGFARRCSWAHLPFVYRFPGRKGRGYGNGGVARSDAGMPSAGVGNLGDNFYSTRYVALASIGFGLSLPICSLVTYWASDENQRHGGIVVLALVVMAWIIWRHRSNLARLRAGTENRFDRKKTVKQS